MTQATPILTLDAMIAQKVGELTILNAKQAVLIDHLKREIALRDIRIERLEAREPELPLPAKEATNGAVAH